MSNSDPHMATSNVFKMAAAAVFDFQYFKFVTVGTVETVQLCIIVPNFFKIARTAADIITICPSLQHVACPPSWIFNACLGSTRERHSVVFTTVQNVVGLYAVVFKNCHMPLT